MGKRRKPQGRVARAVERVALGAVMTVVAFVVERRLMKAIRKRGDAGPGEPATEDPAAASESRTRGLAVSAQEVSQEPGGDHAPDAAENRRHPPRHV